MKLSNLRDTRDKYKDLIRRVAVTSTQTCMIDKWSPSSVTVSSNDDLSHAEEKSTESVDSGRFCGSYALCLSNDLLALRHPILDQSWSPVALTRTNRILSESCMGNKGNAKA